MKNFPIQEHLKKSGLRDTQTRRMVIEALKTAQAPCSPYDIQKTISESGRTINTVTVYRVLAMLDALHLVHRHPCNGRYSLCSFPEKEGHHGFLHCTSCGDVEEFCSDRLCKLENKIARSAKFHPLAHVSELVGVCRSCH